MLTARHAPLSPYSDTFHRRGADRPPDQLSLEWMSRRLAIHLGTLPPLVLILLASIQTLGCSIRSKSVSTVKTVPSAVEKLRNGARLRLPGFQLSVQPQNFGSHRGVAFVPVPIPFGGNEGRTSLYPIWIELSPESTSISFDPTGVKLAPEGDDAVPPAAILGPGVGGHEIVSPAGGEGFLCGRPQEPLNEQKLELPVEKRFIRYAEIFDVSRPPLKESPGVVPIGRPTCFVLGFSTDSSPDRRFVLRIDGIMRNDRPVAVPPLELRRGAVRSFHLWEG